MGLKTGFIRTLTEARKIYVQSMQIFTGHFAGHTLVFVSKLKRYLLTIFLPTMVLLLHVGRSMLIRLFAFALSTNMVPFCNAFVSWKD